MKKIIILVGLIVILSMIAYGVTINTGTEFWAEAGSHINTTYLFTTNLTEVSDNEINISLDDYQVINVKSLNDTVTSNITFKGLGDYSQIFNGTSIYPEAENINNYMQNISPLNRSIIVSIPLNIFRFISIDTTIDTVQYEATGATPGTGSLILNISGTGNVVLSILVAHGYYNIYLNGVFQSNSNANDYTFNQPGLWVITPSTTGSTTEVQYDTANQLSAALSIFVGFFGLFIIAVIAGIIITGFYKGNISLDELKTYIIILLSVGLLIGVGIVIFYGIFGG